MLVKNRLVQFFSSPIYSLLILSIVIIILFAGNLFEIENPYSDPLIFKCYAAGFLYGKIAIMHNVQKFSFCQKFILVFPSYIPDQPFHMLPREYPPLSLIPFSLPFLFLISSYQIIFGFLMLSVIIVFYLYLSKHISKRSSFLFLFLMLLGTMHTAATRFDILPAVATFFCLLAADKKKFVFAYVFLAIAIFLKFYPVLLVFPLFIAEQQSFTATTPFFKKIGNIILFGITCIGFLSLALIINPSQTLNFLYFYLLRPFEFESIGANVIMLVSILKQNSFCLIHGYGSVNVSEHVHGGGFCTILSNQSQGITGILAVSLPLIIFLGTVFVIKIQKDTKRPLSWAFIALTLLMLITGKVLSPQFLIWLIPLIVYIKAYNKIWLGLWISISILTTLLYPSLIGQYTKLPSGSRLFFWEDIYIFVLTLRNGLLIALTVYHIILMRKNLRKSAINPWASRTKGSEKNIK